MSNEEKKDIEDKINDAMAKIVSDTVGDVQPEKKSDPSASHVTARTQNLQDIRSQPDHLMCRMQDLRDHPVIRNFKIRTAIWQWYSHFQVSEAEEISYVPIDESEFAPIVLPKKKKHKALRVTGMIAAMVLVAAGLCVRRSVLLLHESFF